MLLAMSPRWRQSLFLFGVTATATAATYVYIRRRQARQRARALEQQAERPEPVPEFLRAGYAEGEPVPQAEEEAAAPEAS